MSQNKPKQKESKLKKETCHKINPNRRKMNLKRKMSQNNPKQTEHELKKKDVTKSTQTEGT